MNPKQKRIVGILVIANVVVILILAALARCPTLSLLTPTPTHPLQSTTLAPDDCQWQATQLLAQAGLGGTVTLTAEHSLDFAITHPLAPDQTADDAAQSTWIAFDIAIVLHERGCLTFTQVQVTILEHDTQINASVGASDLIAFDTGALDQDEFIERVIFTRNTIRPLVPH